MRWRLKTPLWRFDDDLPYNVPDQLGEDSMHSLAPQEFDDSTSNLLSKERPNAGRTWWFQAMDMILIHKSE